MCYQCSKCNQCGRFSYRAAILCKTCDAEITVGTMECPNCGAPTLGNVYAGKLIYDPDAFVRDGHKGKE